MSLKEYHYAFTIGYLRARIAFDNGKVYNGFPVDSIEFEGYNAGLASKGVTE